eukprot:gnl/MRDRNA2_/MRDRNA2_56158_c0_seq1.p1 gnl/MRDRNA2_/MRDRNA2_56158_c0~~gnl/MRDRNA2_/MRDRNA2_56158_c0_seq1.p1  ORF type:complete len:659 (+),score=117.43 gnl/MRDRNA2_/MRDRNA2_56158_c0_seq1:62-1978(+)
MSAYYAPQYASTWSSRQPQRFGYQSTTTATAQPRQVQSQPWQGTYTKTQGYSTQTWSPGGGMSSVTQASNVRQPQLVHTSPQFATPTRSPAPQKQTPKKTPPVQLPVTRPNFTPATPTTEYRGAQAQAQFRTPQMQYRALPSVRSPPAPDTRSPPATVDISSLHRQVRVSPWCLPRQQQSNEQPSLASPIQSSRLAQRREDLAYATDDFAIVEDMPIKIANVMQFGDDMPQQTFQTSYFSSEPSHTGRVDLARYWEKRRVQNSLRRMLEQIQERFELKGDANAAELAGVFEALLHCARVEEEAGLGEHGFIVAMEQVGAWPPELTEADRSEIFMVLANPSGRSYPGQPPNLMHWSLAEGLGNVPFNLPDFPVPTHLLSGTATKAFGSTQIANAAMAISETFCDTGSSKDLFGSRLISVEEIQAALVEILCTSLVEEAVLFIIRSSTVHFTPLEWQSLVFGPRAHEVPSLSPRIQQQPQHVEHEAPDPIGASQSSQPILGTPRQPTSTSTANVNSGAKNAATPSAALKQESADGMHGGSDYAKRAKGTPLRVVDWSTPGRAMGSPDGGKKNGVSDADEGAGGRRSWNTASKFGVVRAGEEDDPLLWLSMELHSECRGPFLEKAFVRCCQIYEERGTSGY